MSTQRRAQWLLVALLSVTYIYFFQGGGGNQNVRALQTLALVERGTFSLDAYRENRDPRTPDPFILTTDWAKHDGHYFPNKTPGLTLMAAPSYALSDEILRGLIPGDAPHRIQWATYVATVFTSGISTLLLCLLLFHVFVRFWSLALGVSFALAACFGLGTLAFSYATVFQCHMPAACGGFAAFVLAMHLRHEDEPSTARQRWLACGAGAAGGFAVLQEPSALYVVVGLVGYLLAFARGRRALPFFFLGGLPFALFQMGYNWSCFGSPLASSYALSNPGVMFKENGHQFVWPTPMRINRLLFGQARGIFLTSPILGLAILGGEALWQKEQRRWRPELYLCSAVTLALLLFNASFTGWHGGCAAGPRYLLPIFPFFFFVASAAVTRFRWLFWSVAALSVAINLAITLVGNELNYFFVSFPLEFVFSKLLNGQVSINPDPIQWPGWTHEMPGGAAQAQQLWRHSPNFHAFNLGELLFPYSVWSIVPLLLAWATIGWLAWRWLRVPSEAAAPAAVRSRAIPRRASSRKR